jgi:hypothetical protein
VFQAFNLVPTLSALDNITLPMTLAGTAPDRDWLATVIERTALGGSPWPGRWPRGRAWRAGRDDLHHRRSLWARKRRLVATLLAVGLGVAFLAGTLLLSDTLRANFDRLFTQANGSTDVVARRDQGRGRLWPRRADRRRREHAPAGAERIRGSRRPALPGRLRAAGGPRQQTDRRPADPGGELDRRPRPEPVPARPGPRTSSSVLAVTAGVAATVLAGVLPVVRASRVPPLAALRELAAEPARVSRVRSVLGLLLIAGAWVP